MAKSKSWVEQKKEDAKFRKKLNEELENLSISEQLVEIRLSAGITQAELASRVGTTASAISRYEREDYNRYEIRTIQKIVEACGGQLQVIITPKAG